nr:hypothetical protein [Pseudopedobacter sp.]
MNFRKYLFCFVTLLTTIHNQIKAQVIEGQFSYFGFLDNREYARSGRFSQTIFGNRISPEIGFKLDSSSRIRVGFNALYEFGSKNNKFFDDVQPVIYYQYQHKSTEFIVGSFPRVGLLDDYPRSLLSDTLNYYRPNIEGLLTKFETENFRETIWLDWTSRQSNTNRETFLFGFSGKYKFKPFFISHYAYMFHNAKAAISFPGDFVEDNGAVMAELGVDLSHRGILDSLIFSVGGIMSIERNRSLTSSFDLPKGFISNVYLGYKKFSLQNTFYAGQGHQVINGDQFYTSKNYDRIDLGWTALKAKNLEGKFIFSYHFVDGVTDNQQAFLLRYNLFGSKKLK